MVLDLHLSLWASCRIKWQILGAFYLMAIELKLKYCPACGSFVKFDYSNGAIYHLVKWTCTNPKCSKYKNWFPLDGWNEENSPNFGVLGEEIPIPIDCI